MTVGASEPQLHAAAELPAPDSLTDVRVVHVLDADGSALCSAELLVEPVAEAIWSDVPTDQRCWSCQLVMSAGGDSHN